MTSDDLSPEVGQEHSEKKSFLSNIFGFFFDKIFGPLIVVLISGVIIFVYQERSKHERKNLDEAIASARVSTEMLIKQRRILMETTLEYMEILAEIRDTGIADEKILEKFRTLRKKVIVALDTLSPMVETLYHKGEKIKDINIKNYTDAANAFKDATNRPSTDLTQKRPKQYIEEISKELFNSYLSFVKEIAGITRKIVKDETEQAEKELREDTKAKNTTKWQWIPWLRR